jgi:hypothetical protein
VVILEGGDLGEQIGGVLEKSQVKSFGNQRACMRNLMTVVEAEGLCKDRASGRK